MYYQKIKGERIYLSPMDINQESEIITQWFNEDETLASGSGFYHRLLGIEKVSDLLAKWNEGPFAFSIVHKESDAFMGHVTLFDLSAHEQAATLGIYMGIPYRNMGYGKEALTLLIDYAFRTQRFMALHLQVYGFNDNALHVYQQLGFQECGRWHACYYHKGQFHDIVLMELLREQWQKQVN